MKNLVKVLSVVVFGLSMSMANASDRGGEGQDNVQHTKTYQQFIASHSSADSVK